MTRYVWVLEGANRSLALKHEGLFRLGASMTVGRRGDVVIGTCPVDKQISRDSLIVSTAPRGWRIWPANQNGVALHYWAQAPRIIFHEELACEPRVAVRIIGSPGRQYWVLLEDDETYTVSAGISTTTVTPTVNPLTPNQMQALRMVFADYLTWPPAGSPIPAALGAVGRRLGLTEEAVKKRLDGARQKAAALGLSQKTSITDPAYLYTLVQFGYLALCDEDLHPLLQKV
jgi:hypothetical protein